MEDAWSGFSEVPSYQDAERIAERLIGAFLDHRVDQIHAVYTDFRSAFTLRPVDRRLVPIAPEEVAGDEATRGRPRPEYIFEPGPAQLLNALLPRYVTALIFAALLECAASESAARRRAMKAATENAEDLIRRLTREANQARQTEITTELMEIVGGAEALRQASGE
jgi:F-type H+-transporting ATPase subunit gamma